MLIHWAPIFHNENNLVLLAFESLGVSKMTLIPSLIPRAARLPLLGPSIRLRAVTWTRLPKQLHLNMLSPFQPQHQFDANSTFTKYVCPETNSDCGAWRTA